VFLQQLHTFAAAMLPTWALRPCSRFVFALRTVTGTCMASIAAGLLSALESTFGAFSVQETSASYDAYASQIVL
jgi:hypothetical protein